MHSDDLTLTTTARRVLVIEDEPGIRGFVTRALHGAGYAVDEAADGREGLQLALAGEPDCVLLDLRLPGMGGEEVLRRLRRERPGQAVVVWSAAADRATERRVLLLGAHACLRKPVPLADLLRSIGTQARPAPHGPRPAVARRSPRPPARPGHPRHREQHPRHRAEDGAR